MLRQQNDINLKVEDGDNFMSDYTTYTNYAKKAIDELQQLANFKKSLKGKKLADKIREAGLKLITKSGVDSILHGLGESNGFQNLTPAQKQIAEKLVSLKDTALTHKSSSIQGVLDENAEMAQSDITKIIDYSEKLQSMFTVNDNLEDWVKAKLNHACDYVATVRDYLKFYNEEKENIDRLTEEVKNLEQKFNKEKLDTVVDGIQYALDVVGLEPTVGSFADGANVVISLLRSALEKETDDKKKHLLNAAISAVSIVPFGDLAKIIKLRVLRKPAVKLLRFIKNILKSKNSSYTDTLLEKWSNTYKKSIDCSNAKGFSQKAHCAARRKRQTGGKTQSKSVKESYKEALQELLKEQNSSMAMGALKQLNSDAKELQTMLQANTQLEDWVKSKLNLAGEYLDDVYHHLDHFGSEGRTLDEGYYEDKEKERQRRSLRFASSMSSEKKYWVTPDGKVVEAGYSHEDWIKQNAPELTGQTLVDTYDNAVKKGYIRTVLDLNHNFLTLSNLENYDFSMNGDPNKNIPAVKSVVLDAIRNFIVEKGILITATGKGKIIKDLSNIEEDQITEDWKKKLATAALAASTMFGTPDVQAAPTLTRPETTAVSQVRQPYTIEEIVAATLVDEAGGEKNPLDGMHAVLNVIMNRAKGNIRQAAVECLKPKQFSGWNKINKKDTEAIKQFIDSKRSHSKFKDALDLVNKARSGSLKDITKGANHFLNVQLTKQQRKGGNLPSWYDSNKVVAAYGKHRFLKLQEMYELS